MEGKFKAKNVESITFTVNYSDGTKKEVEEGVMFEFIGQAINIYVGTHRAAALRALPNALDTAIKELGLKMEGKIKVNV